MERLKENFKIFKSELTVTTGRIMSGDATVLTRAERMIVIAAGFILGMIIIAAQSPAFAGGDIVEQAKNMAKQYYSSLFVIVPVVAALFLLLAILWAMVVPTNQGARKPIEWGTRILICLIVACSIGGLVALVNNLTNGLNFTP
jgi:glucan phosphoethanolaminetransferase (alkaline phosphatase superfamily)